VRGQGIEYLADALRRNETLEVSDTGLKLLLIIVLTENPNVASPGNDHTLPPPSLAPPSYPPYLHIIGALPALH
jgi:hypothetical protein